MDAAGIADPVYLEEGRSVAAPLVRGVVHASGRALKASAAAAAQNSPGMLCSCGVLGRPLCQKQEK